LAVAVAVAVAAGGPAQNSWVPGGRVERGPLTKAS